MFKIDHNPTFTATARVPTPGGAPQDLSATFKWMTRDEFIAYCRDASASSDPDFFSGLIVEWDADVPCDRDGMATLFNAWPRAGRALFDAYQRELLGVEEKNS